MGLFRYLTLTQIYTGNYMLTYQHQGLTQMWSLAVEVAFYAALPLLSYLLLVVLCRRRWRPELLLAGLAALAALTPAWLIVRHTSEWLPSAASMWLPAYLGCFAGGMAFAAIPLALVSYLVKVWEPLAKAAGARRPRLVCAHAQQQTDGVAGRDVR